MSDTITINLSTFPTNVNVSLSTFPSNIDVNINETTLTFLEGAGLYRENTFTEINNFQDNVNITGNLSTQGSVELDKIIFDQTPESTGGVGQLIWNNTDGTLDLGLKGGNVTLQLGQEQVVRVVNKTGADLLESQYKVVHVSGATGQRLSVYLSQATNDANSATTIGVVTENIAKNQEGFITTMGQIHEINTSGSLQGETWHDGDALYLSPTIAGNITNIKPQAPNHTVLIGFVEYAHSQHGKIFVHIQNGYEIEELHNVRITNVQNNDILKYNSLSSIWVNTPLTTNGAYVPLSGGVMTGSLTAQSLNVPGVVISDPFSIGTGFINIGGGAITLDGDAGIGFLNVIGTNLIGSIDDIKSSTPGNLNIADNTTLNHVTWNIDSTGLATFDRVISDVNQSTNIAVSNLYSTGEYDSGGTSIGAINIGDQTVLNQLHWSIDNYGNANFDGTITSPTISDKANLFGGNTFSGNQTIQGNLSTNGLVFLSGGQLVQQTLTAFETAPLGPSLIDATGWTSTGWTGTFATGFTHSTGNTSTLSRDVVISAIGNVYQIAFTITGRTAGTISIALGGSQASTTPAAFSSNGSFTYAPKVLNTTGDLLIATTTDFNGTISNISVKLITGTYLPCIIIDDSTGANAFEIRNSASTLNNTLIGVNAGAYNTTGYQNTTLGYGSLSSNTTGYQNTATGYGALKSNTTGIWNVAVGYNAMTNNTIGITNTAVGHSAMNTNTTGSDNTTIGYSAMTSNTTGGANTALGIYSARSNTSGNSNVAVGYQAGYTNSTSSNNTTVGYQALYFNTVGNNTAVGFNASRGNTTGTGNASLGYQASYSNASASNNTAIGYQTLYATISSNNTAVGFASLSSNTSGINNTSLGSGSLAGNITGNDNTAQGYNTLRLNTASGNTAIGSNALSANTTAVKNTAVGANTLTRVTANGSNTAVGSNALIINTAAYNTAIGADCMVSNTTGDQNTAIGQNALNKNNTGGYNTAVGVIALFSNLSGVDNTGIGYYALGANTAGDRNSAIGHSALSNNTSGLENTGLGNSAMGANTTGSGNSSTGFAALARNTIGNYNVASGYLAGYQTLSGANSTNANYSIFIGNDSRPNADNETNQIVIGSTAVGNGSNSVTLGNNSITKTILKGSVGIGTSTPTSKLTLSGGDVEVSSIASGVILKSPNGSRFRITVSDAGTLTVTGI